MRWLLVLWACLLSAAVPQPAGWTTLFHDDFEDGDLADWQVGRVQAGAEGWRVEKESGNSVLSGSGDSYLILRSGQWGDYRFSARVKLFQGSLQLFYRQGRTNACPWYILAFDTGGMRLHRQYPCGTVTNLPTVSIANTPGQWYQLDIVGVGTNLKIYRDGVLQLNFTDTPGVDFGTIALTTRADSHAHFDDIEVAGAPTGYENLAWVKTGGPLGGLGYDIRMRPDNPDALFVTDTWSGIHVSTDGGSTWKASNRGITTRAGPSGDAVPVFCATIDPRNPQIIWAGTQNVRGIYKSVDGGATWTPKIKGIVEDNGISFRGITVHPGDSNTVYAMAEISSSTWAGAYRSGVFHEMVKGVIYKTTDGGENWTAIWRGDNLVRYLWIDPRYPNLLFVSTGIFDREAANSDAARNFAGGVGILKSADGGRTWRTLNQANGLENLYVGSLFMHPTNPDILLAATGVNGYRQGSGVYLSKDGGETWRKTLSWVLGGIIYNFTSVEFAAGNPMVAYAASESSIFRSEDGGENWTLVNGRPMKSEFGPDGIDGGITIDFQADPRNADRVFVNSYRGGNFLTQDGGRNWVSVSRGYTGAQIHRLALVPGNPTHVYSIGRNGAFRSFDSGANWEGINYDPASLVESGTIALDPSAPDRLFASTERQGSIFTSSDGGRHWRLAFQHPELTQFGGPNGFQGFRSIVFAPSNPKTIYAGVARQRSDYTSEGPGPSFGVWKSLDGGVNWQEANDPNTARENINVLAVNPRDEATVYVGTVRSGVLRSSDGGRSWKAFNFGLSVLDVRALAVDPGNPSIVYVGLNGGGIYKSTNSGAIWSSAGVGMDPQAEIQDIVIDPSNPNVVYAADLRTGVYVSVNGGALWTAVSSGLSTRAVKALAISTDGGTLYAATEGEGVFRLDITPRVTSVSAASFTSGGALASESIVAAFGDNLAAATASAALLPLPTTLGGVSVSVTDSAGVERLAPLFFVSPGQINCMIPAGTAAGVAKVRVQGHVGYVTIEAVAPGLFTANASGSGIPAAVGLRVSGGVQTLLPSLTTPIDLGPETDEVFLLLFGTGIRGGTSTTVKIGGIDAPVAYAGAQGTMAGLDQVNVKLPRVLAGRGEVDLVLTVDGKAANTVRVRIK